MENTMKVLKCQKPKGYRRLNIYFNNSNSAERYTKSLNEEFLLKKTKMLEHPNLSKRKRKIITFAKPNKYILTKEGSKFLLWENLKNIERRYRKW